MIEAYNNHWWSGWPCLGSSLWKWHRSLSLLLILTAALTMAGCGSGGDKREAQVDYGSSEIFPVPSEIQPNVDFWRHVYGVWSRGQVAFHDDEHMDVIYEVARLPGAIHDGYTETQKRWISERKAYYQDQVRGLERRVSSRAPLSQSDKQLLAKFEKAGGTSALYGASDRVRSQRGLRERFRRGLEISGRYDPHFRELMRAQGVPEDLAYLPHVESSFQTNARSSVGAAGVWQFMPSTGRMYMTVNSTQDERLDPILAANGAANYLSDAYRKLRSWPLAITSYNHGQGGMAKAKAMYGDDIGRVVKNYNGKYFGFASRNFYAEFIAAREVASHPKLYFPEGVHKEAPWPHDRLVLRSSMPAQHVARHYGVSTSSLSTLNMHWRESASQGSAMLPSGSTVWLPAGSMRRVASHPPSYSAPVMVARTEPKRPSPVAATRSEPRLAQIQPRPKAQPKISASTPTKKAQPKAIKVSAKSNAKYHVVKPQETLYRVATLNGISVAQLRKLNKLGSSDNNIRPGQKLMVGI